MLKNSEMENQEARYAEWVDWLMVAFSSKATNLRIYDGKLDFLDFKELFSLLQELTSKIKNEEKKAPLANNVLM